MQFKRGPRQNIDAIRNRGLLSVGEPLFITDDLVFAIATAKNAYIEIGGSGTGSSWGSITGTLSNQTDLQAELDSLQNSINTITPSMSRGFLLMGA